MSVEVEVGGVYEKASDLTPTGTIVAFGGTTAPSGWFLCDGTIKNRTTESNLFDVIGTSFGEGDGSDTFNLPDLRGQFLRGVDSSKGIDPDASTRTALNPGGNTGDNIGSNQDSAMWGHWHRFIYPDATQSPHETGSGEHQFYSGTDAKPVREPTNDGTHGDPNISSESRPNNVYVNYIIKN